MTANNNTNKQTLESPYRMTSAEFNTFVRLVYNECGIALSPAKESMLSARISKRLRALGMDSFRDYHKYLMETLGKNDELTQLVDVVTTNTTQFFRESNHFDYLTQHALPQILRPSGCLRVWSAGCSTGEEPYTISMVLSNHLNSYNSDFHITATDVSTRVLKKATQAVYDSEAVLKVPIMLKNKYLMRGKGQQMGNWRVAPELRKKVDFYKLNFMDDDYGFNEQFEIIFCRNVMIYFDWETKTRLISKLCDHLVPGGYLFIGHSETLNGLNDEMRPVAPTVYRKPLKQSERSKGVAA